MPVLNILQISVCSSIQTMSGKRDKAQKKIARCLAILQRDLPDIQASETPTKVKKQICIRNMLDYTCIDSNVYIHMQYLKFLKCIEYMCLLFT